MVIRTFNQLNVLTILVPIWSVPQRRPNPNPPFIYRSNLILLGHIHNYLQWNVFIENKDFAHIIIEHVVIYLLENPYKKIQKKRVEIFLINRAFAVRELTWVLRDIRVYNKTFLLSFYLTGKDDLPTRNTE